MAVTGFGILHSEKIAVAGVGGIGLDPPPFISSVTRQTAPLAEASTAPMNCDRPGHRNFDHACVAMHGRLHCYNTKVEKPFSESLQQYLRRETPSPPGSAFLASAQKDRSRLQNAAKPLHILHCRCQMKRRFQTPEEETAIVELTAFNHTGNTIRLQGARTAGTKGATLRSRGCERTKLPLRCVDDGTLTRRQLL